MTAVKSSLIWLKASMRKMSIDLLVFHTLLTGAVKMCSPARGAKTRVKRPSNVNFKVFRTILTTMYWSTFLKMNIRSLIGISVPTDLIS